MLGNTIVASSWKSRILSIEFLSEDIKCVVMEKHEFDNRIKTISWVFLEDPDN